MIYQWKWLRPRAGSDTGAVMIFQMSMYYLSFAPLWILVFLTDIFSICDNDKYLVTEYQYCADSVFHGYCSVANEK